MDVNKKIDRTEECRRWLGKLQKCLPGSSLGPAQALFSGFEYTPPLSHFLFGQIAHPDQIVAGKSLRHLPSQQSIPVLAALPHLTFDHSCSCPDTNATALCNLTLLQQPLTADGIKQFEQQGVWPLLGPDRGSARLGMEAVQCK